MGRRRTVGDFSLITIGDTQKEKREERNESPGSRQRKQNCRSDESLRFLPYSAEDQELRSNILPRRSNREKDEQNETGFAQKNEGIHQSATSGVAGSSAYLHREITGKVLAVKTGGYNSDPSVELGNKCKRSLVPNCSYTTRRRGAS